MPQIIIPFIYNGVDYSDFAPALRNEIRRMHILDLKKQGLLSMTREEWVIQAWKEAQDKGKCEECRFIVEHHADPHFLNHLKEGGWKAHLKQCEAQYDKFKKKRFSKGLIVAKSVLPVDKSPHIAITE